MSRDRDRWVLGGLGFDSANRKVLCIHPDPASVEKLGGYFRFDRQSIRAQFIGTVVVAGSEFVILIIERGVFPVLAFDRCALGLQQPFENVIDDPLFPTLR